MSGSNLRFVAEILGSNLRFGVRVPDLGLESEILGSNLKFWIGI